MMNAQLPANWDADDLLLQQLICSVAVPAEARQQAKQAVSRLVMDAMVTSATRQAAIVSDSFGVADAVGGDHPSASVLQTISETDRSMECNSSYLIERRAWLGTAALAATLLLGWVTLTVWRSLSPSQLLAYCTRQLDQSPSWKSLDAGSGAFDQSRLSQLVQSYFKVSPVTGIEYRALGDSSFSSSGCLWKLPLAGGREIYIFEFPAPRSVEGISQHLQLLTDRSGGWSTAAVVRDGYLFVLMSKDDLTRSLKLTPLA